MVRQVQYDNLTIEVPDDATDDEVASIIETKAQEAKSKPFQPGLLERGGRYLAEWGQGIRDAATQPVGGPTGIPLIDAAAGVADFGASMVSDTVTAVPRLATQAFVGARGGRAPADLFVREPTTPTGKAIQDTMGAVFKPAGDALNATGMDPAVAQFVVEAGGTALDLAGLGAAGRGIKTGVRAAIPEVPDPGVNPRRFGPSVERARRLDFRVMPSQVAAKSQLELAPLGQIGPPVPGTFLGQAFTGPEFKTRFIIDNQKRVNAFAAKELGISAVTPQGLQLAKNPHLAVYNEVVQALPYVKADWELGNAANEIGAARRNNTLLKNTEAVDDVRDRLLTMERIPTQKALDAIREYRQLANKYYRQADASTGIGSEVADQAGDAYRAAADALEQAIERQTKALYPDLVPRLQAARTQLAKIHNVEDSFDGVNVDPQALATLGKRFPLSGYLQDIADISRDFPDTMKSATGIDLPIQSQQGVLNSLRLATQRFAGRATQTPRLMSDEFQNRYGRADPDYDPRPAPPAAGPSPIVDYTPPDPNLPGGADVMPPAPGGGPGLTATGLGDQFDTLPAADAQPGDLTASTPPVGGSIPAQDLGVADELAGPLGLEVPPPRFTAGQEGVLDAGLPFAPDPEMASASIVRGGAEPGPVADSELLAQALLDAELRGRPLDPETGAGIAPEGVDRPFTRPAPDLGADLVAGLEELLGGGPRQLEDLQARGREGDFEPGVGPQPRPGHDPYADAVDAEIVGMRRPDAGPSRPLPPPDDLAGGLVEPATPPRLPPPDSLGAAFDGPELPPQNPDAPTRPDGTVDLAEQMRRIEADSPRRSTEDVMAREDLEENTIAARDARAAGEAGPRAADAGLGDELTIEEPPARVAAQDIGDDNLKLENLPKQSPGDVSIKRTKRPPADMIPRKPLPPNPVVYYSGPARNPTRWLVMEEQGDTWQLRSIDSTAFKKQNPDYTRPPGRDLYVTAARDARDMGKTLNSDTDMTVEAIEMLARAVKDGDLVIDDWDNAYAAAKAALEQSGGKRISRGAKGGEPWFKNIRPGR